MSPLFKDSYNLEEATNQKRFVGKNIVLKVVFAQKSQSFDTLMFCLSYWQSSCSLKYVTILTKSKNQRFKPQAQILIRYSYRDLISASVFFLSGCIATWIYCRETLRERG